ncbi:MAG: asparagine synthase (glutamine-hydrolyzing) [Solirubrobacteraceae bacterium]
MCGISGAVSTAPGVARSGVRAQLACQRHRGPDAAGYFDGGLGVVAQNRLSIIDVLGGDPPLTDEAGAIGAVLNGEIYNFQALRADLERTGHMLRTRCDTEVLAHLAECGDAVAVARALDGMFAFAVYDRRREQLILGRDRVGKKPIYYWRSPRTFVFGSEIKSVLAHPAVPCALDEAAISAYLTFGYVPTPDTFFAGIKSVPPAHVLTVSPGGEPRLERYWRLATPGGDGDEHTAHVGLGLREAAAEVRARLLEAVGRRLVADVPLGAFLSGGIDSSAIVALMSLALGEPVKTFTIGFEDRDGFDERPFARAVAERFGTEHHELVVQPDAIDLVERLVWHHDQPFGDSSAIPTYLLNEHARGYVTVALSGDGGDELFGGYERFAAGVAAQRMSALAPILRTALLGALAHAPEAVWRGGAGGRARRFAAAAQRGMPSAYLDWISYVSESRHRRLLPAGDDRARDAYRRLWQSSAGASPLDRLLALNLDTYLVDDLLVKLDRTSMAHGLEVRSPFLDTALLEFASRLAPSLKVRGLSLKRVLKAAVADLLPPALLSRRKRGFGVPLDRWFREDLGGYAAATLGAGARVRRHVAGVELDRLLTEHATGSANHGHALWTLTTLELFLRRHDW